MNTTSLPEVHVQWHYSKIVASSNTIGQWISSLPVGTIVSVQEATDHIMQAVRQSLATKPNDYEESLRWEMGDASDEETVGYAFEISRLMEPIGEEYGYVANPLVQYRRI